MSYSSYSSDGAAYLAYGSISGVFAVAIAGVGILTCVRARRRKDPARQGFLWLKAMFALSFLAYLMSLISYVATGASYIIVDGSYYSIGDVLDALNRLSTAASITDTVFISFAEISMIGACIEIGNGFIYALTHQHTSSQKMIRTLGFVGIVVIFILTIAYGGFTGSVWNRYQTQGTGQYDELSRQMDQANNLYLALIVMILVLNLVIMVQASMVMNKYRNVMISRQTVSLYLVATVLAFVRKLWGLIRFCLLSYGYVYDLGRPVVSVPVNIIFSLAIWFIVLVLLCCVGIRRHNGLWTTPQPWIDGTAPVAGQQQQQQQQYGQQGWYGQQQVVYQQAPGYPPPNTVMYQPQPAELQQPVNYGWQQQQPQQQHELNSEYLPSEVAADSHHTNSHVVTEK